MSKYEELHDLQKKALATQQEAEQACAECARQFGILHAIEAWDAADEHTVMWW